MIALDEIPGDVQTASSRGFAPAGEIRAGVSHFRGTASASSRWHAMANPNPSPDTRFQPGKSGNPTGKSAETALRDHATADLASRFRHALLSSVQEKLEAGADPFSLVTADVIRVLKDSEDRAHGTPKQSVEHGGEGGGPIVFKTVYE